MEDLAAILRRERDKRGWTQDRVAEACGLSRQQLSRYETGARTPAWATFHRILAVFGAQPRVVLDPRDSDVVAAIARQRRRPSEEWLDDVAFAADLLHQLLAGLEWQASGVLALRLLGAPAPLRELEAEVALDDVAWARLVDNARGHWMEVWDPDECVTRVPTSPAYLQLTCEAGDGELRWTGVDAVLVLRIVSEMVGPPVRTRVGRWEWRVAGVDRLAFDDPWLRRVLAQIRRGDNSGDSGGSTA
jgi:transcriptional regulator with XRE-family HTH domain